MPIGDLTSQLFSNVYLNRLDQYMKRELGFRHYGRYVDDFYLISEDRHRLLDAYDEIAGFLVSLGLRLHPGKTVVQDTWRSMAYLGAIVYPYHRHCTRRTIKNYSACLDSWRRHGVDYRGECVKENVRCVRDSYRGYFSHFSSVRLLQRLENGGGVES